MMVGIVTMPIEIKYFGKKATIVRNVTALAFSLVVYWSWGWCYESKSVKSG